MHYLILGKNGWLGSIIYDHLIKQGKKVSYCHHDINSIPKIDDGIDVVINCAAVTNIDWAEKNKQRTFWSNVLGAVNVAKACKLSGAKYIFFSSACIFDSKDITDIKYEDSIPNPKCFYTETKVMAEKLIQEILPQTLIIRPRLPLSEVPHPRNTINKLLTYDKINDNQESVTVVEDMIPVLINLIEYNADGIYHIANAGTISPAEIAEAFGHKFTKVAKEEQDKRLADEGRAKRVTTYVGSNKIPLLPNIRERIISLVDKYNGIKE